MAYKNIKVFGKNVPRKMFFGFVVVAALMVSLGVGVFAVKQKQNIERSEASSVCANVFGGLLSAASSKCSSGKPELISCVYPGGASLTYCVSVDEIRSAGGVTGFCKLECEKMVVNGAPTSGGGTTATPATQAQNTCSGQCLKAGDFGVSSPRDCGSWGKDSASGSCGGGFCCKDKADLRPAPQVTQLGINGGGVLTVGGKPDTLTIKPVVNLRYSRLKVKVTQEEVGSWYNLGVKDSALELGFSDKKTSEWTGVCDDTNPDPNKNSCDGHVFSVLVYGLNTGTAKLVVKVTAYDGSATGSKTGSNKSYTVK